MSRKSMPKKKSLDFSHHLPLENLLVGNEGIEPRILCSITKVLEKIGSFPLYPTDDLRLLYGLITSVNITELGKNTEKGHPNKEWNLL